MNNSHAEWRSRNKEKLAKLAADYKARHPDRVKRASLKSDLKKLGVTVEKYDAMMEAQSGCCKICGRHSSAFVKRLHVDHSHATGVVRGLLCSNCNHLLGHARDSKEILTKAIAYLTRFDE